MKITCGIATALFLCFTYLQFNDLTQYHNADWWSWVLFYLVTAGLSFLVGWGKLKSVPTLTGFAGFALGSFIFRMQDQFGNFEFERFAGAGWFRDEKTTEMVQQTNEAGGLLMVSIWVFILAFLVAKGKKSCESAEKES